MTAADKADLGNFISLCVKAKEWDRLAQRVHSARPAELEALSHYCAEPAAEGLAKKEPLGRSQVASRAGPANRERGQEQILLGGAGAFRESSTPVFRGRTGLGMDSGG